VTAVASFAVLQILIGVLVAFVVVPVMGFTLETNLISGFTSVFVSMLIVGYIFAGKIQEGRREAIARIVVLSAFYMIFAVMFFPTLPDWAPKHKQEYQAANPGTTLTSSEWFFYEQITVAVTALINVITVVVIGFIGLYIGSMLRKPSKS